MRISDNFKGGKRHKYDLVLALLKLIHWKVWDPLLISDKLKDCSHVNVDLSPVHIPQVHTDLLCARP